ncbi:uncharacterized protein SAMN02745221_01941 [Thermosyntropha lipolytica DSM 11003]|uniref:Radical SAM core domain-containing protein n=1 Tax=Thermosyntropha lipolytica DSM 11003 TaxID=1123382 RepID=A0A1M5R5V7_9FIRM|nr:thioether cross-link-forming SCIFF peptide maturase [Thermosyntropha lipolytica]SHH21450.1 uncharacterized protein SAMN02745221_01941 [Thermosyntropha lipolytica DSM 11003]
MEIPRDYDFKADVHLYQFDGLNILLDVNSGAIHLLDDLGFAFISTLLNNQGDFVQTAKEMSFLYPPQQIKEIEEEVRQRVKEGSLFTPRQQIELDFTRMPVKALCLNVAHTCNMRCTYCFAGQGDFGGKPELMTAETARKALDFLLARSGEVKHLEIDFFGGEPLLNLEVVKETVAYGREREKDTGKKFNFTLTTNALRLDEATLDYLLDNDISLILSLDGRREINDRHRILPDGQGSYDLILPHIMMARDRNPGGFYVRGTFTRENLDFSEDLKHIVDLGIDTLSLEPAIGDDKDLAISEKDLPYVLSEYENLTRLLWRYYEEGREISFFHYNLHLQQGPCLAKRITGCGAGYEYLAVTPKGDIYPCHQFIGRDGYLMGNVETGEIKEEIRDLFACNNLNNKEKCMQCWARYFCGGGCHASHLRRNGDITVPDEVSCAMHRKRIEGAIYLDIRKKMHKENRLTGQDF